MDSCWFGSERKSRDQPHLDDEGGQTSESRLSRLFSKLDQGRGPVGRPGHDQIRSESERAGAHRRRDTHVRRRRPHKETGPARARRPGNGPVTLDGAALLVIDVQKAIDHPSWGVRNNPDAESNIAALLAAWRASGQPVYHIRHDSTEPQSHYRPGQPGHDFKPEAPPVEGEPVVAKPSTSAFIATALRSRF